MFTLSDASRDTKKILIGLGLTIGGLLCLYILFNILLFVKETIWPTPPPKPTLAFGKLQPQVFPQNVTDNITGYTINTLTGNLPNLPSQARVYKMEYLQPDLLAVNKFRDKVTQVGFNPGYTAISDKIFEWKNNLNSGGIEKRIRTNIVEGSFTITSDYISNKDVLSAKDLPNQESAISKAQDLLTSMQMAPDDVDLSQNKTNLFFIKNGSLSPASSLSNAQIIEVNFPQKDIDKLPIFYERPYSSNISILIAGGGSNGQIVGANYFHQAISDQFATYPLKSVSNAFQELKQGNGYIASYFGDLPNIVITDVVLGYYVGSQPQDFLMPVFVFKGDNGFNAYVPAVMDEWINK